MLTDAGAQVLWERSEAINLAPGQSTPAAVSAGLADATGKFYLEATLTSPTGQTIASDRRPFYVFPGDVALMLDATPSLCRPGQTITLTGQVQNRGVVTLTGQTLTIVQDGAPIYSAGPFDLPPGDHYPFAITAVAPAGADVTFFEANVGETQVSEMVQVAEPTVALEAQAPPVAGSQPFSLTISLANTGLLDASVEVTVETSDPQISHLQLPISIPAGEMRLLQETYRITHDTIFTVTLTGDLEQTSVVPITFGEAATAAFSPQPVYPEGTIAIPYTLTNTGQLAVQFTTTVAIHSPFSTYLPVGAVA